MTMAVRFVVLADTHYHPAAPKDFSPPKLLTRGPEILEASSQLATDEHNHRWAGEFGDRDITIMLPRARAIWHS